MYTDNTITFHLVRCRSIVFIHICFFCSVAQVFFHHSLIIVFLRLGVHITDHMTVARQPPQMIDYCVTKRRRTQRACRAGTVLKRTEGECSLVGIIPAFEQEPPLHPFMLPLVQEIQEFWNPSVRLLTGESPRFKLQLRLALMCGACDIPAARKVCDFMGHSANLGCSRRLKPFPSPSNNRST